MTTKEKQVIQLNLDLVRKALADLRQLQKVTNSYVNGAALRDIYRGLHGNKANSTANRIMICTESLGDNLNKLEDALRDAEVILLQQAQHYEQTKAASS